MLSRPCSLTEFWCEVRPWFLWGYSVNIDVYHVVWIRTMDSFTGTMVSLRIKIPSRYTTWTMTRIQRFCHFTDVCHHLRMSVVSRINSAVFAHVSSLYRSFRRFFLHMCLRIGSTFLICHSAVFANHSINLYSYSMSVVSVSIAVWDRFRRFYTFLHTI